MDNNHHDDDDDYTKITLKALVLTGQSLALVTSTGESRVLGTIQGDDEFVPSTNAECCYNGRGLWGGNNYFYNVNYYNIQVNNFNNNFNYYGACRWVC